MANDDVLVEEGQVWDTATDIDGYDTVAEYIANNACATPDERIAQWTPRAWLPGNPGETVLDVGCANGNYAKFFTIVKEMVYTGCDASRAMLKLARELNPECEFFWGRLPLKYDDTSELPFDDDAFDLVFCTDVLHHLPTSLLAIRELLRVGRKYVVVHQRAYDDDGRGGMFKGPHGEIVRLEMLEDVRKVMRRAVGGGASPDEYIADSATVTTRHGVERLIVELYYVFHLEEN